jgi:hypothetical protein
MVHDLAILASDFIRYSSPRTTILPHFGPEINPGKYLILKISGRKQAEVGRGHAGRRGLDIGTCQDGVGVKLAGTKVAEKGCTCGGN